MNRVQVHRLGLHVFTAKNTGGKIDEVAVQHLYPNTGYFENRTFSSQYILLFLVHHHDRYFRSLHETCGEI